MQRNFNKFSCEVSVESKERIHMRNYSLAQSPDYLRLYTNHHRHILYYSKNIEKVEEK